MYLSSLNISGFRCFNHEFKVEFKDGLNVIVGENGSGKTAIISAIRQLFQDSESGKFSVTDEDFSCTFTEKGNYAQSLKIQAEFDDLNTDEKVVFLPLLGDSDKALLNLEAQNKEVRGRFKKIVWGGKSKSSQFDSELLELIQCIYLTPLRDAESKLSNGRQSRLSKLLKALNRKQLKQCKDSEQLHPLEEKLKKFNESIASDESLNIKNANNLINQNLTAAVGHYFGQKTIIQFAENDFTKIAESLKLLFFPNLSVTDQELFRSLSQNSLGYNNLLYIASILAELTLDDLDEEQPIIKLLLIEEPEAHLHPQLQIKLLNHLKSITDTHKKVQVIVTTHSPVLASSVDLESIIHLSKLPTPVATPLKLCGLPLASNRFINRWLDATKSNLLFAGGIILVEGIAEQMLIPALAEIVLRNYEQGRKSLEDQGVSVINLNGIYFRHFMQLYCNLDGDEKNINIPIRCAGITDLDPPKKLKEVATSHENQADKEVVPDNLIPYDGNLYPGTNHAIVLQDQINKSINARLFICKYKTLEYDLAMEGNNLALMCKIIASQWPKPKNGYSPIINQFNDMSDQDWSQTEQSKKGSAALELLKRIEDENIGKGLFAQLLADSITENHDSFIVPDYIKNAILWSSSLDTVKDKS